MLHVIGRGARFHLVKEPEPLLGERQGNWAVPAAARNGLFGSACALFQEPTLQGRARLPERDEQCGRLGRSSRIPDPGQRPSPVLSFAGASSLDRIRSIASGATFARPVSGLSLTPAPQWWDSRRGLAEAARREARFGFWK